MRRIALATLLHDRVRTAVLVAGLSAGWALVAVQLGLYRGFELSSRAIVDRVGGDVWVGAAGVRVVDDGEPVQAPIFSAHPCVTAARPLIVDYTQARRPDGSLVTVQLVAVDHQSRARVPWRVAAGDRSLLETGATVGIDAGDARKLGMPEAALDRNVRLRDGKSLRIVATTQGATAFTQTPYLFVSVATARRILNLPDGTATFWVLEARDASCKSSLLGLLSSGLKARSPEALAQSTRDHWIESSGIGSLLEVGTLIAIAVGIAVMFQSAITIVKTHATELATIRALGASRRELAAFVTWQVGTVAAVSTLVSLGLAAAVAATLRSSGLLVVVDASSLAAGLLVAALTTVVASFASVRVLGRVDPRRVLE